MSESSADNPPGQLWPPSVMVIPGDACPCPARTDGDAPACAALPLSVDLVDSTQERDICWASYSGWTMLPGFAVCLVLTACIAWLGFALARPMAQTIILGAGGII